MAMTRSVFACYDYVIIQFASQWISFLNSLWKVILLRLNGKKWNLKIHRPVSLLPVCGKTFEKLIFNSILKMNSSHLINRDLNLVAPAEINFLAITHGKYKSFDNGFEVR